MKLKIKKASNREFWIMEKTPSIDQKERILGIYNRRIDKYIAIGDQVFMSENYKYSFPTGKKYRMGNIDDLVDTTDGWFYKIRTFEMDGIIRVSHKDFILTGNSAGIGLRYRIRQSLRGSYSELKRYCTIYLKKVQNGKFSVELDNNLLENMVDELEYTKILIETFSIPFPHTDQLLLSSLGRELRRINS